MSGDDTGRLDGAPTCRRGRACGTVAHPPL